MDQDALNRLHAEIAQRVTAIRTTHPDWLCAKGCDTCCRQLADIPQLRAAEWDLLQVGLAALPATQRTDIAARVAALATQPSGPYVCPLLDLESGACPVYAQRPVACRSYGFYVQRDLGLYCRAIEVKVAEGVLDEVLWGNHDAVDRQLSALGESRSLIDWFIAALTTTHTTCEVD
jgi:Fe-S-cluster containining protein